MSNRLRAALRSVAVAEENLSAILKKDYPLGGSIRWTAAHGGFRYSGAVILHGYGDRIRVRNVQTSKTRWITSYDIVGAPL